MEERASGSSRWLQFKRRFFRAQIFALPVLAVLGAVSFTTWIPRLADRHYNSVRPSGTLKISEEAWLLHRRLLIADLHADPLIWDRDLLERHEYGQLDLPRLLEGNVALQVFAAPTKAPAWGDRSWDRGTVLVIAQLWPPRTWASLKERALYQAQKLHESARRSDGKLTIIDSVASLQNYLERRAGAPQLTAGLLAVEGLHALEGDERNVDLLFEAGFRMMGLTHFFDNAVGGSAHGIERGGLTEFGRRVVRRMEELGVVVDLSHASERTIDDTLDLVERPLVFSHTGVRATCNTPRNVSDAQLRRVAENGGVVGIAFFQGAVCGTEPAAIVRAVRHVTDLVGIDHVALGSDFDGAVETSFDVAGLALLSEALLAEGYDESEISQIMGGNVFRLLLRTLR